MFEIDYPGRNKLYNLIINCIDYVILTKINFKDMIKIYFLTK